MSKMKDNELKNVTGGRLLDTADKFSPHIWRLF